MCRNLPRRKLARQLAVALRAEELTLGLARHGDAQVRDYLRQTKITVLHPAITGKMRGDRASVVAIQLSVLQINNLLVTDVPIIVTGSTQADFVMDGAQVDTHI